MKREILDALGRYPVFSVRDVANALGKSREYAYLAAYRLAKSGEIAKIEKGKYTAEKDPFAIASSISWPSYISCQSALRLHGLTGQLPFTIHVVTTRKRKNRSLDFGNARIEFITCRKGFFLGFGKAPYQGREIFLAEGEKALVDAVSFGKMTFGEAAALIGANKRKLSMRRLFSYASLSRGLGGKLKKALKEN